MGLSAEFSKIAKVRSKSVMMRFGDIIIRVIMCPLKSSKTSSQSVTKRRRQNTLLFLFNKLIEVKFGHSNSVILARVIYKLFRMSG